MGRPANLVVNILGNAHDLLKALGETDGALGKLSSAAGSVVNGVAAGWTVAAVATAKLATSVFKTGIEYNTLEQRAGAAFRTVLGSQDAASKMMGDLRAFARTSPFPRQAFIESTQQMLGFGIESSKVIPILDAVQNAVAATGRGSEDIAGIVDVLSKVQSSGKITATTLNQLGLRGIDAATLIGSTMGKTGDQIRTEISRGALDAEVAIDALTTAMATKFAGAAEGVKATWDGARDRIKGALRDIGSAMAQPFVAIEGGGLAVEWANKLADALRALEPIIPAVMEAFQKAFGPQLAGVGTTLEKITGLLKNVNVDAAVGSLSKMAPVLGVLTGAFGAMTGGLFTQIPVIGGLMKGLSGPVGIAVAAIAGLVATSPDLQQLLGSVLGEALKALQPLIPVITGALQQMAGILGQLVVAVAPLIPVVVQLAGQLLAGLMPPLLALGQSLVPLVVSAVQLLTPVLGLVADAFAAIMPAVTQIISTLLPPLVSLLGTVMGAIGPLIPVIASVVVQFVNMAMRAIGPLLPSLGRLITALLPVIPPIAQIITQAVGLIGAFMPLIDIVVRVAGVVAGALSGALAGLLGGGIKVLAGILEGVATAFGWVADKISQLVGWLGRLKWPSPPGWLSSIGNLFSRSSAGLDLGAELAVRSMADVMGRTVAAPRYVAPAGLGRMAGAAAGGLLVPVDITINVTPPTPGGDAYGRAIRDELRKLARRDGGSGLGRLALGVA